MIDKLTNAATATAAAAAKHGRASGEAMASAAKKTGSAMGKASAATAETATKLTTKGTEAVRTATTAAAGHGRAAAAAAAGVTTDAFNNCRNTLRSAVGVAGPAAAGTAAALAAGGALLTRFAENLDWSTVDPTKYLYAGTRGVSRGMEEAARLWGEIPVQIRMDGPESVSRFLETRDWSHIIPYSEGGSNASTNGIWEYSGINRARGAERMTSAEIEAAQAAYNSEALRVTIGQVADSALTGGLVGAAVAGTFSVIEEGLRFQRREIDEAEMLRRIGHAVARAGAAGAAISALTAAAAMAFPALISVLTWIAIPLAVIGLGVFGLRLVEGGRGWLDICRSDAPLRSLELTRVTGEWRDQVTKWASETGTTIHGLLPEWTPAGTNPATAEGPNAS